MPGHAIFVDHQADVSAGKIRYRISICEAVMAGMDTRGRRDPAPDASDFRCVAGAAVVAIAAILLSFALGVPVPPDALMLVAP
jgi:hypothetical protein